MTLTNKYIENINALMKRQESKGLETYGQLLQDNHEMTTIDRIEYLEEELVDAMMYLEHLKESVKGANYQNCKFEQMTNADRIRNMSNDELAEIFGLMAEQMEKCYGCPVDKDVCRSVGVSCERAFEKWLERPVEV